MQIAARFRQQAIDIVRKYALRSGSMSQSNKPCCTTETGRPLTVVGLLQTRGALLLTLSLVSLITNGGAG
ncbi:MAG TPA: hypothetical protein VHW71_14775 [Steroidobacteraceae bacterium]|nr:hypothetical protein [Steroidobacteraceae bacterium]